MMKLYEFIGNARISVSPLMASGFNISYPYLYCSNNSRTKLFSFFPCVAINNFGRAFVSNFRAPFSALISPPSISILRKSGSGCDSSKTNSSSTTVFTWRLPSLERWPVPVPVLDSNPASPDMFETATSNKLIFLMALILIWCLM